VKRVLRLVGDVPDRLPGGGAVVSAEAEETVWTPFFASADFLDTDSGRRAFVDALNAKAPRSLVASWAIERRGLHTLRAWLERVTAKESGKAFTLAALRTLLTEAPADLNALRSSGVVELLARRFATHPIPECRAMARRCRDRWMRAASKAKSSRGKEIGGGGAGSGDADDVDDEEKSLRERSERGGDAAAARKSKPAPMTMDEMIASAEGLAEGKEAAEARRVAAEAEVALEAAKAAAKAAALRAEAAANEAAAESAAAWAAATGRGDRSGGAIVGGKKRSLRVESFEAFASHKTKKREHKKREKLRREREDAEDEAAEEKGEAAEEKAAAPAAGAGSDAVAKTLGAAAAALMDVDPSPEGAYREKVRRQIVAYVHAQIKRGSSGGRKMSKAESAAVEAKVAAKVLERSTSVQPGDAGGAGEEASAFLTSKRKEKIKRMLEHYCK
jgi:hypothetical protein